MTTGGMPDATMTRACLGLRTAVLSSMTLERFRFMLASVMSAGPAPRSPAAALHRTARAWRTPGRGAYTREHLRIKSQDGDQPTNQNRRAGQVSRPGAWMTCHASAGGSHDEGSRRDGRCTWCGRKFRGPAPEPELGAAYRTELGQAYRQHYDPDWGTDPYDS